jgi:hypothetical protein
MLQKVVRSTVIDAPIERVWAVLRDFNSHDQWHDVVAASRIEHGEAPSRVGCVRSFTLKDGNRIREQLLALSDTEYKSTYTIVQATVPLQRYVATVTLKPVTDGDRTFWHWESTFDTPPGMERELRDMVAQGVYEAGFENLRRYLGAGGDRHVGVASRTRPTDLGVGGNSPSRPTDLGAGAVSPSGPTDLGAGAVSRSAPAGSVGRVRAATPTSPSQPPHPTPEIPQSR